MGLIESHEDHMNRMATDILDCPKCESEDVHLCGCTFDEDSQSETEHFQCNHCDHLFDHYT